MHGCQNVYNKDDDEKTSSCLGIIETSSTFEKVLSPILGSVFATYGNLIAMLLLFVFSIILFLDRLLFHGFLLRLLGRVHLYGLGEGEDGTTVFPLHGQSLYILLLEFEL